MIHISDWNSRPAGYVEAMTVTKSIPADYLRGLDVHRGDTLRVLEVHEEKILVEIQRAESVPSQVTGAASDWLRTARGSVHVAPNQSADDVRMAKYGLGT
jgi:hypothetical protein